MRSCLQVLALTMAWVLLAAVVDAQEKPRKEATPDVTIRGKIVKMEAPDRFVVRTTGNKEVIFYSTPQTRYVINGKAGRYADLRVGTEINAGYIVRDDRYMVNTVTIGGDVSGVVPASGTVQVGTTIRGKILKVQGSEQVVVRTADNKEVFLFVNPTTRYLINGKAGRFADLRVGLEVNAAYAERDSRYIVETFTVGTAPEAQQLPAGEGTLVEGTVLRVVGEDQVIVRTPEKKEVIVYVGPQTKYLIEDQPARFIDFRTGSEVRIYYDVRDRRNMARSILGVRRK